VPALLVLLALPASWAYVLLATAIAARAAVSIARRLAARDAGARPAPDTGGSSIRLGTGRDGRPLVLSEGQLSAHGLILGASGAGKTTTMLAILAERIRTGHPVIAIDMKGSPSFVGRLAEAAHAAGRPFRLWTPDGPDNWNPLEHGNATELKDKLIATERFTEPHYQRAAERYVQTVLQVLHAIRPERPATLADVVTLMDPLRLSAALRGLPRERAEHVQDYLATMTPDQLSAVRGLGTRLAIISESHTGPYLAPGGGRPVDLRAALNGEQVVVFSLNSSIYGRLAAQLGTLAIQDLIAATGHRLHAPGEQAIIAIDEFSALGADNVVSLLARGREAGNSVLLATQELADLDRAGRGFRDQVLGVTAVKIVHRQDVPRSAQTVCEMVGTHYVWEPTYQLATGPLGAHSTSRGTRRLVERPIVHPNEIMSLATGEALVLTKIPRADARIIHVVPPQSRPPPATPAPGEAPRPPTHRPSADRSAEAVRGRDRSPATRSIRPAREDARRGPELG